MEIVGITDRLKIEADRVEVRGGGGCLPIVGIPFVVVGCLLIGALASGIFQFDEGAFASALFAGMSLICIAFGAVLVFGRYALQIDGRARIYRKRFSVLLVIKETAGSLDEFDNVVVRHRVTQRSDKSYRDYSLELEGPETTLDVAMPGSIQNARRDAEQVAKALRLPLVDRTGTTEIVREADNLDESLRQRRHRTGEGPGELPSPPEGMKIQFRIEGDEVVLEVPPAGFTSEALGSLIGWTFLFPGFVVFLFRPFRELAGGEIVAKTLFALLVMLLSICAGTGICLRSLRRSYTLRVSPQKLHLTTHGVLFTTASEIPAEALEELRITLPKHDGSPAEKAPIVARSDQTTIEFGHDLPPEDKEWVKTVLELILTT